MTNDSPEPADLTVLDLEPQDLDGHSIDELSDYLDRGRTPPDPTIEQSPSCRRALAGLARLEEISRLLADEDVASEAPADESWVQTVLQGINLDAHAGADFPLEDPRDPLAGEIVMTEGALRGLVRAVGDESPSLLVGRVRFRGDLTDPTAGPLTIRVDVDVVHGHTVPDAVSALRSAIRQQVAGHTRFQDPIVDITVRDLLVRPNGDDR